MLQSWMEQIPVEGMFSSWQCPADFSNQRGTFIFEAFS